MYGNILHMLLKCHYISQDISYDVGHDMAYVFYTLSYIQECEVW